MELCHLYMKKEAGEFLAWCGMENVKGPINACSNGGSFYGRNYSFHRREDRNKSTHSESWGKYSSL